MVWLVAGLFASEYWNMPRLLEQAKQRWDLCPFESVTTNKELLGVYGKTRDSQFERGTTYELIFHPRHTRAYQSLRKAIDWSLDDQSRIYISPSLHKLTASAVDEDGNTYLNRVLLSHFLISENEGLAIIRQLSKRGKLPLTANKYGQTPLMLAVEASWPSVFREILKLKPSFSERDAQGRDAVDYLEFCRPFVAEEVVAARRVFKAEVIAQMIFDMSTEFGKPKVRKVITEWLVNPWRATCGNYPEGTFNLTWPALKKAPKMKPEPIVYDRRTGPYDLKRPDYKIPPN